MKFSGWMHTLTLGVKQLKIKSLGVILETGLSFSSHVKEVTKSAYYHLKNIARIRCFVSSQDLEKLVHAFITSRVDYCNGLLTGLPKKTIRQLQLIQYAAARILTRTRKSEHITPVLRFLHWLPVIFRIDFKVLLLIYKSLNGLGPKYIADMLTEYKPNSRVTIRAIFTGRTLARISILPKISRFWLFALFRSIVVWNYFTRAIESRADGS